MVSLLVKVSSSLKGTRRDGSRDTTRSMKSTAGVDMTSRGRRPTAFTRRTNEGHVVGGASFEAAFFSPLSLRGRKMSCCRPSNRGARLSRGGCSDDGGGVGQAAKESGQGQPH